MDVARLENLVHRPALSTEYSATKGVKTPESQDHHDTGAQESYLPSPEVLSAPSSSVANLLTDTIAHHQVRNNASFELAYGAPSAANNLPQKRLPEDPNGHLGPDDSIIQSVLASMDASWYLQSNECRMKLPSMEYPYNDLTPFTEPLRITDPPRITFPPGNPTFPSTFSAHLAACEFFIKQNKIYKKGSQGGSDGA